MTTLATGTRTGVSAIMRAAWIAAAAALATGLPTRAEVVDVGCEQTGPAENRLSRQALGVSDDDVAALRKRLPCD